MATTLVDTRTEEEGATADTMAPDMAKKGPKVCKKYAYTEHSKYSQWEKERRARFNDKLEELARVLPGHSKENPWKKIEILEQAIGNVTKRRAEVARSQEDAVNSLAGEVNSLKTIILRFTEFNKAAEDIFAVSSAEIRRVLEEMEERDKENKPPEAEEVVGDAEAEDSLAFVAKIARSNDHDYTRTVAETPSLEVEGEVVVETVQEQEEVGQLEAVGEPVLVDLVAQQLPAQPSYIALDPAAHPTILADTQQVINLQDILWPRGKASVPNVMTVFVNKGSRASLLPSDSLVGATKLPIPRLKQPKRVPKSKKPRRAVVKKKVATVEEEKVAENEVEEELVLSIPVETVEISVKETNVEEIESLENLNSVDASLPLDKEVIDLQNNEEMEILEETIKEQGERETREKSEKDAKKKEGKGSSDKDSDKVVVHKKKVDTGKKKSKSSYSIAALCQISVNIGDRPEMANSPGVLSLNSVGTMSPSHTPAPTPTPDPTKTFGMEALGITMDKEEENVLEELRTIRPEDVSFETPGPSSADANLKKNVSPSQNFLTNFPAVSKADQEDSISVSTKTIQRDIYQALKDLDKELNLESEALVGGEVQVAPPKAETKKVADSGTKVTKVVVSTVSSAVVSRYLPSCTATVSTPSTTASAMSVYDFSATKPETPPIPLQKTRKQEPRREEVRTTAVYKSPEKKTYTEMQSKPKKSPPEGSKAKEGMGAGGQVGQQYPQAMEYQHGQAKAHYQQPPASYQSRHQMYMGHYTPYQSMAPLQQQHPYQHTPHHPYPPGEGEMKGGQSSHHSRYSCSSHAYLPAPNYHHYPSGPKHYPGQGQPAWGPHQAQHYPKARERAQPPHMDMEAAIATPTQVSATTFTVNQLVNSSQRKSGGTKRSSTVKSGGAAKAARGEVIKEKEKEDCRKRSGGSRRNKSGGRSTSYSAESLMMPSSSVLTVTADTKEEAKLKSTPTKKEGKQEGMAASSRSQASNSWANTDHFSGLQLSSLSPSPASLFPQDLSSLDFPMPMFGPGEGKEYGVAAPVSQASQKTPGKQQAACQRAAATVADWTLNSTILEGGWPLPTLTPPGDPMGDPMASYNFMSPMPHNHTFYPCSAPQSGGRPQGQAHSYSAHSAANIPVSGYSSSTMVMTKAGTSQPFPPSQAQTGSLVNFNLSTIFPEINIPAVGHAAPNCQVDLPLLREPAANVAQVKPSLPALPHPGSLEFLPNSHR